MGKLIAIDCYKSVHFFVNYTIKILWIESEHLIKKKAQKTLGKLGQNIE